MSDLPSNGLPEGWTVVNASDICDVNPRKPAADALPTDAPVTFVPMAAVDADLGAIVDGEERPFGEVRPKSYTPFAEGDVLLAKITPCMENGKAAVARGLANGLGFGTTEFHVFRSKGSVLPEYLYHYIRQQMFRDDAQAHMAGAVGQLRVPAGYVKQFELPLPPLAEQERIVTKVEALLARVRSVRQRLAAMPGILKHFRQAVLAHACSGKLTEDWRNSSVGEDEIPEGWELLDAGQLYEDARYGTSQKCSYENIGLPVLRVPNIARGVLELGDLKYAELSLRERDKLLLREGDVIVCRTNGSLDLIGKAAVIPAEAGDCAFASYLVAGRVKVGHFGAG